MDPVIVDGMSPSGPLPVSVDERVRRRIQQWMAMSQTSQTVLAIRIGKDQPWMSRYLRGLHDADLATLEKIASAFGHTLFALLDLPTDAADAQERRVIEMYRALKPAARANIVRLLEDLTRPRAPRRVPK
jgi:transcriptional regulator with XRE-family HTH domain